MSILQKAKDQEMRSPISKHIQVSDTKQYEVGVSNKLETAPLLGLGGPGFRS